MQSDSAVDQAIRRIHSLYPWLAASSVAATHAASGLQPPHKNADSRHGVPWDNSMDIPSDSASPDDAAHRGSVTHKFLQHLNFEQARDAQGVRKELDRMILTDLLSESERLQIPIEAVTWFVASPLADAIRRAPDFRRELRFVTTEPLCRIDPTITTPQNDQVLVRGMIDGILVYDDYCEIIDFKTDAVTASEATRKCESYRPQMEVYARAVRRLWNRPVRRCRLVFLSAKCTIDLEPESP